MSLLQKTKQLCKEYNIKPARSRGQSFLIRENVYDKIIEVADLNSSDVVLEIGPGLGFLTERLAKGAKKVIAVEIDKKLVEVLEKRLKEQGIGNVEVVEGDILKFSIADFRLPIDKIVANLPYNITSIFLRKFLSGGSSFRVPESARDHDRSRSMVLMLQKEVAERIVAKPGKMSLLAVSVQFYSEPKIIDYVSKENFWPKPEVDSAIINLRLKNRSFGYAQDRDLRIDEKEFFQLVKFGFSAKRKMLKNNLAGGFKISSEKAEDKLKKAGFSPKIRAQ